MLGKDQEFEHNFSLEIDPVFSCQHTTFELYPFTLLADGAFFAPPSAVEA